MPRSAAKEPSDLLYLGNRAAVTPRQLCEVVAWGRRRQPLGDIDSNRVEPRIELLWTKVAWLAVAYASGTLGSLAL